MVDYEEEGGFVIVRQDDVPASGAEPEYLAEIARFVHDLTPALWPVNKTIHDNPELGYEERIAHKTLTSFMEAQPGWKVTRSAYGMETAWTAVFDSGTPGPVVSFNVEMDALPGIGHACGHNLIATASLAGGLATAQLVRTRRLPGRVVVFGTPAEEGGGGKIALLRAGAYTDHGVDLSLISHPGIVANCALMRTTAYTRFRALYRGREAHAAATPWMGINALDALITAYNGLSVLRQQTMAGDIIQGVISEGGVAPNIIPARAAGVFVVRADTQARLRELREKVDGCFAAGALATGAKLTVTDEQAYADHVPNRALARSYTRYFNSLVGKSDERIATDQDVDEMRGRSMASTDQGDVSYAMPSLSVGFAILPGGPLGTGPHSPEFALSAGSRDAFQRALRVGKALAGTAVDVLTHEGLLDEVKREWRRAVGGK